MSGGVLRVIDDINVHLVTIIVVRNGSPEEVSVVSGVTSGQVGDLANSKFKQLIEKYAESRSLDEEQVEEAINDGYIALPGTEYELFLVWPNVENDIVR